jgi:hypothetical protein
VTVFTDNSAVDTLIGVYGADPLAQPFGCDDDSGDGRLSAESFNTDLGDRYYVQVGGCNVFDFAACGAPEGEIDVAAVTDPPPHDNREAARPVTSGSFIESENLGARMQAGREATSCGSAPIGASVWFKLSTRVLGDVNFTATGRSRGAPRGSDVDSVMALYAGNSARPLTCNDDAPEAGFSARVARRVGPGEYFVQVGGYSSEQGLFEFQAQFQPVDDDRDGVSPPQDCNDRDPNIRPGVAELVNNEVDENCDGVREYDRDGDGARVPGADCDDGNPSRRPGIPEIRGNAVDENCDNVAEPFPVIPGSQVGASWQPGARITRMLRLTVADVPGGSRITVRCRGKRCKFKSKSRRVNSAKKSVAMHRRLKKGQRKFRRGTRLEIRITKPGYRGKVRTYRFLRSKAPKFTDRCLEGNRKRAC